MHRFYLFKSRCTFYLHNHPRRPVWSRTRREPRDICGAPGRARAAWMDTVESPWERKLAGLTQPWARSRGAIRALPATGKMSGTFSYCQNISIRIIMYMKENGRFPPSALPEDHSFFSSISQLKSLLKMVRILCGVSNSRSGGNVHFPWKKKETLTFHKRNVTEMWTVSLDIFKGTEG